MRNRVHLLPAASVLAVCLAAGTASAAPILRVQVDQKGDFLLIGNTIGYDCAPGTPVPVVGTVGACGNNTGDSAPDIFWRSDVPALGQAQANNTITQAQARSTAKLTIPVGATVTHAFLYWGATLPATGVDTQVTLERPGAGGFAQTVNAITSYQSANNSYQSVADVTAIVQANGTGTYRVAGIDSDNWIDLNSQNNFGGWWMAVFYSDNVTPLRNLALYEGLDNVSNGQNQNVALSGLNVPNSGYTGRLGVVTYEGDDTITGDSLFFNSAVPLTNGPPAMPLNPPTNFFNGTRSTLGLPVSVVGDAPQLTGGAGSMSGMDLDIVDVTANLTPGLKSAPITATSTGDVYFLAGFITSISTFTPDFSTSVKTATDLNGGSLLAGDVLQYTIVVNNTGNDASIKTVLTDVLPAGVTYVPGSLQITVGANAGNKTDALADDQGDYNAGTNTVKFRLGVGADGTNGGNIPIGGSTTVTFKVKVNAGASGTIANQATINAAGSLGSSASDTPTDGNGPSSGAPPTNVVVDQCATDAECSAPTPHCKVTTSPKICVQCLLDAQCPANQPTCAPATNTCVCVPSGAEVCDGKDNDCNGTVDDGFNVGTACSAGLGACLVNGAIACNAMGTSSCSAIAGEPLPEDCGDLIDNDCDGVVNNGCLDTDGDGLPDVYEVAIGTNPNDADSDDDGVPDGQEVNPAADSDGDGLINALDPDSDNDGLYDGTELGKDCNGPGTDKSKNHCIADADPATTTDPLNPDTDGGGVKDGSEDANRNGKLDAGEGDPTAGHGADDSTIVDSDGDGLSDIFETSIGSNPMDADSDDDGVPDGQEANPADDTDGDGIINVLDVDSDNDGLYDGTEMGKDCNGPGTDKTKNHCIADADPATTTSPLDPDTDHGGKKDGSEDANRNGAIDVGETDPTAGHGADDSTITDSDGDGLSDIFEIAIGSNPNDADTDDDGVIDGQEANPADDTDGDGLINVLDVDSDNDGLYDGTEQGKDCSNPATDTSKHHCIADADPATTTSPLDPDTDHGGKKDGSEDPNRNGKLDAGEGDPTAGHGADDATLLDSDGDGLTDIFEVAIGSNPMDADSDDDGVIDGQEPNPADDTDGDGTINVLDVDSDNDGLYDGTEMGKDCSNPGTDTTKNHCIADGDMGATKTSPLDPDTDHGGVKDGSEDINRNGVIDGTETDPTAGHGSDDAINKDTDGDGLSDVFEVSIGTDPSDADSDDDGVIDGKEPNPADDTDGDGKINALDPDSDNDGLFDGTELGLDCSNPATDPAKKQCIADADKGATTTNPLDPDTDKGSVKDGTEDANHNGKIDPGETDPNLKSDDVPATGCKTDADCGALTSGKICDDATKTCTDGCRGKDGNTCPDGKTCSSMSATAGVCVEVTSTSTSGSTGSSSSSGGGGAGGAGGARDGIVASGNGLICSATPGNNDDDGASWLLGGALVALVGARRRRRAA